MAGPFGGANPLPMRLNGRDFGQSRGIFSGGNSNVFSAKTRQKQAKHTGVLPGFESKGTPRIPGTPIAGCLTLMNVSNDFENDPTTKAKQSWIRQTVLPS